MSYADAVLPLMDNHDLVVHHMAFLVGTTSAARRNCIQIRNLAVSVS